MRRLVWKTLLAILPWALPSPAPAQIILGQVVDDLTGRPLSATRVLLLDSADVAFGRTETDALGSFVLKVPRTGRYRVLAERLAYDEVRGDLIAFDQERTFEIELRMVPLPLELGALAVSAERQRTLLLDRGFYNRRERSGGYFLDADEIAARRPHRVTDLLRSIPGVMLLPRRGEGYVAVSRRAPITFSGGRTCRMKVVVDGYKLDTTDSFIDDYVHASEVIGIEVYLGAGGVGAPVEHRGRDAFCGVLMIWTR